MFGCFSKSTIFANSWMKMQRYWQMDNEYHSHWWNLIVGSTLYLNVTTSARSDNMNILPVQSLWSSIAKFTYLLINIIEKFTLIGNCALSFSNKTSEHIDSGVELSHIWLVWSASLSVKLSCKTGLLDSWLCFSWQDIYRCAVYMQVRNTV